MPGGHGGADLDPSNWPVGLLRVQIVTYEMSIKDSLLDRYRAAQCRASCPPGEVVPDRVPRRSACTAALSPIGVSRASRKSPEILAFFANRSFRLPHQGPLYLEEES